jgi:transcriptional regulator with XRE-family HTH domain
MANTADITILRHPDGSAQHAILSWDQYQALLHAAHSRSPNPPAVPPAVQQSIDTGTHPVRAWREYQDLNQGQLAAMVGISRAYLAQIEGGERTGTIEVMARLARALGRSIEDLIASGARDFASKAATLGAMPAKLKEIVSRIDERAWRSKPAYGGFSLLEHVGHLRDIDGEGYRVRLERMLLEQRPALPDINGDALATERAYNSADLATALTNFTTTRLAIVARLAKLSPEERRRTGLMAGTTEITVEGLAETMMAHDSEHLDQLDELCAEVARRQENLAV